MTPEQTLFREQQWLGDREGPLPNVLFSLLVAQQDTFGPVEPVTTAGPYYPGQPIGHSEVYAYNTRYSANTDPSRML